MPKVQDQWVLTLAYFIVGIIQLFAIWDGVKFATDFGDFVSFLLTLATTYVPILGSVLGVYGAVNVWDWGILQSLLLFFWFLPVGLLILAYSHFAEK